MEVGVLVLLSFFAAYSLAGVSGLVRGPCLRLVGERSFFVGGRGGSESGAVARGGSMEKGWGR